MSLEKMMMDQMFRKDKYRKDCGCLVTAKNSPVDMCFCNAGCKPNEVLIIMCCQIECEWYKTRVDANAKEV